MTVAYNPVSVGDMIIDQNNEWMTLLRSLSSFGMTERDFISVHVHVHFACHRSTVHIIIGFSVRASSFLTPGSSTFSESIVCKYRYTRSHDWPGNPGFVLFPLSSPGSALGPD